MIFILQSLKKKGITMKNVYFLSDTCLSDASVDMESTTFGTDQTAKIQAIFDKAINSKAIIVWDIEASISAPILVYSNTQVIGAPGCGVILRDNSNCVLFQNASRYAWGTNFVILDYNIHFDGLIINGNGQRGGVEMQEHDTDNLQGWTVLGRMSGVKNFTFRNMILRNSRTFSWFTNCYEDVIFENIKIEYPTLTAQEFNLDGCKFLGPGEHLTIKNIRGNQKDDIFSVCANDVFWSTDETKTLNQSGYICTSYDPSGSYGNINHTNIDDVYFDGATSSWRILSLSHSVKNLKMTNVGGQTVHQMGIVDNYGGSSSVVFGSGATPTYNFEDITIENHNAQCSASDWFFTALNLGGKFKNLSFDGIIWDVQNRFPFATITQASTVDNFSAKNIKIKTAATQGSLFAFGGTMKNINFSDVDIICTGTNSDFQLFTTLNGTYTSILLNQINANGIKTIATLGYAANVFAVSNLSHKYAGINGLSFSLSAGTVAHTRISNAYSDVTLLGGAGTWSDQKGDAFL